MFTFFFFSYVLLCMVFMSRRIFTFCWDIWACKCLWFRLPGKNSCGSWQSELVYGFCERLDAVLPRALWVTQIMSHYTGNLCAVKMVCARGTYAKGVQDPGLPVMCFKRWPKPFALWYLNQTSKIHAQRHMQAVDFWISYNFSLSPLFTVETQHLTQKTNQLNYSSA